MSEETTQKTNPIYKIGIGRQIVLWFILLLFLPFFISMPVMMFMRITHGQTSDAISLGIIFLLAFIAISFIILQILAAGRQKIAFHEDKVSLKLPTWRGPTPFGPTIEKDIAYSDIKAIEKRGEIYAFLGALGLREVSSLLTNDGSRHVLGYSTENEADAAIPYDDITNLIAERSGIEVTDIGTINAGTQMQAIFSNTPSWEEKSINAQDLNKIRARAKFLALLSIGVFIALVCIGIGIAIYPEIMKAISTSNSN